MWRAEEIKGSLNYICFSLKKLNCNSFVKLDQSDSSELNLELKISLLQWKYPKLIYFQFVNNKKSMSV